MDESVGSGFESWICHLWHVCILGKCFNFSVPHSFIYIMSLFLIRLVWILNKINIKGLSNAWYIVGAQWLLVSLVTFTSLHLIIFHRLMLSLWPFCLLSLPSATPSQTQCLVLACWDSLFWFLFSSVCSFQGYLKCFPGQIMHFHNQRPLTVVLVQRA